MSDSLFFIKTHYVVVLYHWLLYVRQLLQASAANAHITGLHSHSLDAQINSNYINVSLCPGGVCSVSTLLRVKGHTFELYMNVTEKKQ